MIGDITKLDTPLEYFFDGNITQSPSEAAKDHAPLNTSFLVWGGLFPPPTETKNCQSSFDYVFIENFGLNHLFQLREFAQTMGNILTTFWLATAKNDVAKELL